MSKPIEIMTQNLSATITSTPLNEECKIRSELQNVVETAKRVVDLAEKDVLDSWRDNVKLLKNLEEDLKIINDFIASESCSLIALSSILEVFSKNNLKEQLDYGWRYEEKHKLFRGAIEHITRRAETLIQKTQGPICSLFNIIFYLSLWDFKPSSLFVENLVKKSQELFVMDKGLTPEEALRLFDELCRLNYRPAVQATGNVQQQIFFSNVAKKTLPLLLRRDESVVEGAPFQPYMYREENLVLNGKPVEQSILPETGVLITYAKKDPSSPYCHAHYNLAMNRQMYVSRLLNKILASDYEDSRKLFQFSLFENLNVEMSHDNKNKMLALKQKPNVKLLQALECTTIALNGMSLIGATSPFIISIASEKITPESEIKAQEEAARLNLPKVFYFETETYRKHLFWLLKDIGSYKGFIWYLKKYSQQIAFFTKINESSPHKISFSPLLIDGFLKLVRNKAYDIENDPEILKAFGILFKESIASYNVEIFKKCPNIILNILWLNMYLSMALNKNLAYANEEQAFLFNIVSIIKPDLTQARFLYEIKAMGWNGSIPFPLELEKAMCEHFKSFDKSSNPSEDEKQWFEKIKKKLGKENAQDLQHDYICPITGHEIDIAYLPRKVAIHIDGPTHFNPKTGSKNLKTIFRDKCLEQAGWLSIDIYLSDEKISATYLDEIMDTICKRSYVVLPKTNQSAISTTPRPSPKPRADLEPILPAFNHVKEKEDPARGEKERKIPEENKVAKQNVIVLDKKTKKWHKKEVVVLATAASVSESSYIQPLMLNSSNLKKNNPHKKDSNHNSKSKTPPQSNKKVREYRPKQHSVQ